MIVDISPEKQVSVVGVSDWMPVDKIPTKNSGLYKKLVDKFGLASGCYQFAKTEHVADIGKELIHKDIGYTGMGKDVFARTGDVRSPSGRHGVNRIIRANSWDKGTDVRVRYLFTKEDDIKILEDHIHEKTENAHGFRFAWKEASAGTDGVLHEWMDIAELKLTADDLIDCLPKIRQIIIDKKMEEVTSEIDSIFEQATK